MTSTYQRRACLWLSFLTHWPVIYSLASPIIPVCTVLEQVHYVLILRIGYMVCSYHVAASAGAIFGVTLWFLRLLPKCWSRPSTDWLVRSSRHTYTNYTTGYTTTSVGHTTGYTTYGGYTTGYTSTTTRTTTTYY
jgi:hypothetical protein